MEKLSHCPSCNSIQLFDFQSVKDYFGEKEMFNIMQCFNCSLLFTNPRPDANEIVNYYQSSNYVSHGDSTNNHFLDIIYSKIQNLNFKYKYRIIQRHHILPTHSLLDFGCGSGNWLTYMKNQLWSVAGTEPNDTARQRAIQQGNETYTSLQALPKETQFSLITAFHVLEHVHELHDTLGKLESRLTSQGTLILALPNPTSADATYYGSFWAGWDVPRHLYHFKPADVFNLAHEFGLELVEQYPLKWDSFYVSLLSEQYKGRKLTMPRAIFQGLKSNFYARKTDNYSSLIYVLRKP